MHNQPQTLCRQCNKYIPTANFLLHDGRCKRQSELRSSRISQCSDNQNQSQLSSSSKVHKSKDCRGIFKKSPKEENQQKWYIANQKSQQMMDNPDPSFYNSCFGKKKSSKIQKPLQKKSQFQKSSGKKKFEQQEQQIVQEKITCPFCGYGQSLAQLDTHPTQCQHRETQCRFCQSRFPRSLMQDHEEICENNPRIIQNNQRQRQRQRNNNGMRRNLDDSDSDRDQDYVQQGFLSPFFTGRQGSGSRGRDNRRQQRNLIYSPSPLLNFLRQLRSMDETQGERDRNNGNNDNNRNNRQHIHVQFGNRGNGFYHSSSSSNPSTFIHLIDILANNHMRTHAQRNPNPGMSPEEIASLNKVKYKKDPKSVDPDICTICYCEFEQQEEMIKLKCNHDFHPECISEWLKRVSTCPVCKNKIKQRSGNGDNNDDGRQNHNNEANNNDYIRQGFQQQSTRPTDFMNMFFGPSNR